MRTSAYSIYDVKDQSFAMPMFVKNDDIAIRNIVAAAGQGSLLSMFPQDFELYQIGEFDAETGHLEPLEEPRYIGRVLDFKGGENSEV